MTNWITSDLHIGHVNLAEKWRAWAGGTVESHNDMLRKAWNHAVHPGDTVWIIGDACMGKRVESVAFARTLNGEKHLLPGNHDNIHPMIHHKNVEKHLEIIALYETAFIIEPTLVSGALMELDESVIVSHFPWYGTEDHAESDREHLDKWMPVREEWADGTVLVHGHTHQDHIYGDMSVHAGVDSQVGMMPWRAEDVQKFVVAARLNGGFS